MTEQMSALLDGELAGLDQAGLRAALKGLCEDSNLRCDWALAHLIGDHLRGKGALKVDFARRGRERLAAELTVVVVPGSLTSRRAARRSGWPCRSPRRCLALLWSAGRCWRSIRRRPLKWRSHPRRCPLLRYRSSRPPAAASGECPPAAVAAPCPSLGTEVTG